MSFTHTVQIWFERELGGSLILPDGWYGRPYDNQHQLTALNEVGGKLEISLDDKLMLRFEGLKSVEVKDGNLVFGPFDRLRFDWEWYGTSARRGTKEYGSGKVRIVSSSINSNAD